MTKEEKEILDRHTQEIQFEIRCKKAYLDKLIIQIEDLCKERDSVMESIGEKEAVLGVIDREVVINGINAKS